MAWGYRLELLGARDAGRYRDSGRGCSAAHCEETPHFVSAYRYVRAAGAPVTATRPLCVKHARVFSMRHGLAWPDMLRRFRRPLIAVRTAIAA
jgi:hypothetical protein